MCFLPLGEERGEPQRGHRKPGRGEGVPQGALPFSSPGELPNPLSSALQVDALPLSHLGSLNISVLYPI